MAFGVKVHVDIEDKSLKKLRSQIQTALDNNTQHNPIKIRHLAIALGRQESERVSKALSSAIASQPLSVGNIKVGKFEATSAIDDLRKQLTTMMSGLSITGLKDFLGTEGVEETYEKAAEAAERLAKAQERAGKRRAKTASVTAEISALQKLLNQQSANLKKLDSAGDAKKLVGTYMELQRHVARLKTLEKDEQRAAMDGLKDKILALRESIATKLKEEEATRKQAKAEETAGKKRAKAFDKAAAEALKSELDSVTARIKNAEKLSLKIDGQEALTGLVEKYRELYREIERVKTLEGEEQRAALAALSERTLKVREATTAQIAAEQRQAAQSSQTTKKEENLAKRVIALRQRIQKWIDSNTRAQKAYGEAIKGMQRELENTGAVTEEIYAKVNRTFTGITENAAKTGLAGRSMMEKLMAGYAKYGGWSIITRTMGSVFRQVHKVIDAVKELDAAMTELRKVTNLTEGAYSRFEKTAAQMAKRVGSSVSDAVNATADFARLGFELDESAALAEAALIYKNIGDGIEDVSIATQSLISTIKAFGYEAEDAMTIVDMFNEVGNNFAISSSGIGDALQRSASALFEAGNTLEQSIGLVTAMNSVIQDPDQVGTALKTMTMYIRAARVEAEAAGIETDEMADSVASLREKMQSLTGVDIMIDDSTFKSTYEIIREIAEVWDDLTSTSRSAVLNMLGGKRNANVIASLIQNFETAEEAMASAMDSFGSATMENEKYLDSINGKISLIKASFDELSSAILSSDLVKLIADIINGLTSVLTIMSRFHVLWPVVTGALGLLNGAKNYGNLLNITDEFSRWQVAGLDANDAMKQLIDSTAGLSGGQRELLFELIETSSAYGALNQDMQENIKNTLVSTKATTKQAFSLKTFGKSIKSAWQSMSALNKASIYLAGAEFVLGFFQWIRDRIEANKQAAIDAADEVARVYEDAQSTVSQSIRTLNGLETEYKRLSAGVNSNGENVKLSANEYDRYLEIVSQVVAISPQVCKGYDESGRALVNYTDLIKDAVIEQEKYLEYQDQIFLAGGDTVFSGMQEELRGVQDEASKTFEKLGWGFYRLKQDTLGLFSSNDDLSKALVEFGERFGIENIQLLNTQSVSAATDEMYRAAEELYERRAEFLNWIVTDKESGGLGVEKNSPLYQQIEADILAFAALPRQIDEATAQWKEYMRKYIGEQEWFAQMAPDAQRAYLNWYEETYTGFQLLSSNAADLKVEAEEAGKALSESLGSDQVQNILSLAVGVANGTVKLGEYKAAVQEFLEQQEAAETVIPGLEAYLWSFTNVLDQSGESATKAAASYTGLAEALKQISEGNSLLETAKKEMLMNGTLSADTVASFAAALTEHEKLTDYIYEENGALKLNEEAWNARSNAIANEDLEALENRKRELELLQLYNEYVKMHQDETLDQIALKHGENYAQDIQNARKFVQDHIEELASLEENLEYVRSMIKLYEVALKDATSVDVTKMFDGLGDIGTKAKEAVDAINQLLNGAVLTREQLLELAEAYPELLNIEGFLDLSTMQEQLDALGSLYSSFEQRYDAFIQQYIDLANEALEAGGLTPDEASNLQQFIANAEMLRDMQLRDIMGGDDAGEVASKYQELKEVTDDLVNSANMLGNLQSDGDIFDKYQQVAEFLETHEGFSWDNFFNPDGSAKIVDDAMIDEIFDVIMDDAEELEQWTPELEEKWRAEFKGIMQGATETQNVLSGMSDALGDLNSAGGLLADMKAGGDYMDMLRQIVDFVSEHEGFSLSDFLNADGNIKEVDESMIERVFKVFKAELEAMDSWEPEYGDVLWEQFQKIVQGAQESVSSLEALSSGIGKLSGAANLLADMKSGEDYLGTLQSIVDFVEESKGAVSLQDFINDDGSIKNVDSVLTDQVFDALIGQMKTIEGYTDGMGEMLRQSYDQIIAQEQEIVSSAERVSSALSSVTSAGDFSRLVSGGEASLVEQIEAAIQLAETLTDEAGKVPDWTSWVESFGDSSGIQWNLEAIRALSDAQVDAAFAATGLAEKYPELITQIKAYNYESNVATQRTERMSATYSNTKAALDGMKDMAHGAELTYEAYQELIAIDARFAEAVHYQNGVLTLNSEKYDDLTQAIIRETLAQAEANAMTIALSDEYQKLTNKIGDLSEEEQQRLDSLNAEIMGYATLASELENAASAYNRFKNASSEPDSTRYSAARDAREVIENTLYNEDSDIFGKIGRDQYRYAVEYLIDPEIEVDSDAFDDAWDRVEKYITDGGEGVSNFYNDLMEHGFIDPDTFEIHTTVEEVAKELGISQELVRTMFDELNEYQEEPIAIDFRGVDEKDVEDSLSVVERYLGKSQRGLQNFYNDLVSNGYLDQVTNKLTMPVDEMAQKMGISTELAQQMIDNLNALLSEDQQITPETDTSGLEEGTEAANRYTDAVDGAGEATETAEEKIGELDDRISALENTLGSLNPADISLNVNPAITAAKQVKTALQGIIDKLNKIKDVGTIKVRIQTEYDTSTSGTGKTPSKKPGFRTIAYGQSGDAVAGGTKSAPGGRALVGELGTETVVDPHKGVWYTVGTRGAEFVTLPKDAIVFNAEQTKELFSMGRTSERGMLADSGTALAEGNSSSFSAIANLSANVAEAVKKVAEAAKEAASAAASANKQTADALKGNTSFKPAIIDPGDTVDQTNRKPIEGVVVKKKGESINGTATPPDTSGNKGGSSGGGGGSGSKDERTELEKILELYQEVNKQSEHLIEHFEFIYRQFERGMNYAGMESALQEQVGLYKQIMESSQKAVQEMIAAGADDTSEELQTMEEAYWSAYDSLYATLDEINALYVDALNKKIDDIQTAYSNLSQAAQEYNDHGGITMDTFQGLIANGTQYLSLLDNVNGQYVINTEGIQRMIAAEKEQLAIENAIAYLNQVRIALEGQNEQALANLVNLTNQLSTSSWDAVYAQAAMLKAMGLTDDQYNHVLANINALRDISQSVITDISASLEKPGEISTDLYEDQIDALDEILKLTEELIEAEVEERIDAIEDQIDAYQKIVDLKKESLRTTKEEEEYARDIADKTGSIADLQAKIDLLALDDSREARAERAALEAELAEKQQELHDTQSDHSLEKQEDALDKMAEAYEEERQKEIEALERSISSAEKLHQLAIQRLTTQWDTLYEQLIAWNTEAGSTLNSEITDNWLKAAEAVKLYGSYLEAVAALQGIVNQATSNMDQPTTNAPSLVVGKVQSEQRGLTLSVDPRLYGNTTHTYHDGGIAGDVGTLKETELLAKLEKGEAILDEPKKKGLYRLIDFNQMLSEKLGVTIGSIAAPTPQVSTMIDKVLKTARGSTDDHSIVFSPNIKVELHHSGNMDDHDAVRVGQKIAKTALDELYEAFQKRGVSSVTSAKLKQ